MQFVDVEFTFAAEDPVPIGARVIPVPEAETVVFARTDVVAVDEPVPMIPVPETETLEFACADGTAGRPDGAGPPDPVGLGRPVHQGAVPAHDGLPVGLGRPLHHGAVPVA